MRSSGTYAAFALVVLCAIGCTNSVVSGDQNPPSGGDQGENTGGDHDSTGVTVAADGVKLTPQTLQLVAIGESFQITATVTPANATDKALTWESTKPDVASVDSTGRVTAKSAGAEVFITATTHSGHFQTSVNVTVGP